MAKKQEMNLKPGDRVSFLNEKGGGYVTRVVSDTIVNVSIEEGFEIPYQVTELLKVSESTAKALSKFEELAEENPDLCPLFPVGKNDISVDKGAYLAMVPEDQDKLLESNLEFFLVNHTGYEVLFGIYLNRKGEYHGFEYGYVEPNSMLYLATLKRSKVDDWLNGIVQIMFFAPGKATPLNPASATIKFKPLMVLKHESFQEQGLLRQKAILLNLALVGELEIGTRVDSITPGSAKLFEEKSDPVIEKISSKIVVESFLEKHKLDDKTAEVDLHVNELVDNPTLINSSELLALQLDYFKKCLEQARVEMLGKVVFIHGVGNGTLKSEILRYLQNTEGVNFYDAPYARYGSGATEVLFYRNK